MTMISTKPYLIRALYEWCLDNGCTPYLATWVNEHTRVPAQYVQDNQIVLSISPSATKDLQIDNEWVSFHARFGGVSHEIWIPVGHVIGLYAKETGEGMGFEVQPYQPDDAATVGQELDRDQSSLQSDDEPAELRAKVVKFKKSE
ncbi:ClpXP protease specificity-enhancing factor [Kingella kingae]|uniref:ClpXP protease specificity-enhancing factor n=1 Tax=Kingella kingae TaxID=504 RepID=UPI000418795B|nr:ClpXP protease specificity-enhancing factor [Kingella kingae]MDK4586282.1 ClpXP protease specificity-enhancing factor [Kingella kingae]MDK4604406.1 ClpXP protease specificity-enhancing factor [Kingella kingae]MDK4630015.1 ClpXP protease specificity-enhancing factor [Kingella kingae]MDK4648374.1 ClpXP protease specificity-enhancing factor [Kingella kingae]